jgi:serine/threonine protein kinase
VENKSYEVFGKYILLEKLAAGGMAEVFLSRAPGTSGIGKFVAIKRILPQFYDTQEFIDMFRDEAKIAINLSHSNVVSIYEFGVEKDQFYLVMDYVEGRNLRQILNKMKKSNSTFSIDQIIYICKEVAGGLDHAHRCHDGTTGKPLNITHRDMSPQNIMISYEGEVKIVDFGIAKAESQLETTRAGTLKGKFGYMSPEQAEGQPVDLRTDIFSLGTVLWELLANDRLFIANNELNTLRKIRECQIPSLRKINPNIHAELERVVQKALARDRNLRYQTAAAMHRDLSRYLNRQFPDFSPHDFSVFVKTLFSDEIIEARKHLIDYSKVSFDSLGVQNEERDNSGQRTVTGPGPTSQASASGARLQSLPAPEGAVPIIKGESTSTNTQSQSGNSTPDDRNTLSDSNLSMNAIDQEAVTGSIRMKETTSVATVQPASANKEILAKQKLSQNLRAIVDKAIESDGIEPKSRQSNKTHPAHQSIKLKGGLNAQEPVYQQRPVLSNDRNPSKSVERYNEGEEHSNPDDDAIASAVRLHQQMNQTNQDTGSPDNFVQNPNAMEPTIDDNQLVLQNRSNSNSRYTANADLEESGSGRKLLNIATGSLLALFVYAFAAKFYTAQMTPLIRILDPHLSVLHSAIGIDTRQTTYSSKEPLKEPKVKVPTQVSETVNETVAPPIAPDLSTDPSGINPDSGLESQPSVPSDLLITSTPSGAEIYINGASLGRVTPSKVKVPSNEKFMITLKRGGYIDYERQDLLKSEVGIKFAATLQKALVGYLNIDVIPPRAAKIYINGQKLSGEMLPIFNYAVPAETWIVVRAEEPVGSLVAEEKIYLSRDQKRSLTLYLKKKLRTKRQRNTE